MSFVFCSPSYSEPGRAGWGRLDVDVDVDNVSSSANWAGDCWCSLLLSGLPPSSSPSISLIFCLHIRRQINFFFSFSSEMQTQTRYFLNCMNIIRINSLRINWERQVKVEVSVDKIVVTWSQQQRYCCDRYKLSDRSKLPACLVSGGEKQTYTQTPDFTPAVFFAGKVKLGKKMFLTFSSWKLLTK